MSTASVSLSTNVVKSLDSKSQPDEIVKPDDVADATKLARILTRILSLISTARRAYRPNVITFRDIPVAGTSGAPVTVTLTHKLGGLVDWWIVRARGTTAATSPFLTETSSDGQVLTLSCYGTGTIDVRVQDAG